MTDTQLLAEAVSCLHAANGLALGSPEAIADCKRRVLAAQLAARHAIDSNQDVADRLVNGAASDGYVEYETDHEQDENDIQGAAV